MRVFVALVSMVMFSGGVLLLAGAPGDDAAALGSYRLFVPGIASDRAAPPPQQAPTALPSSGLRVYIGLTMDALEPAVGETGTEEARITAWGDVPFGPVTRLNLSTVMTKIDEGGCNWVRFFEEHDLFVSVSTMDSSRGPLLILNFSGATWYWLFWCPDPDREPPIFRLPKSGEIQLLHYLGEQFAAHRERGQNGRLVLNPAWTLQTPPSCIERHVTLQGSAFNGKSTLQVLVYDPNFPGGCVVP